MFAQLIAQIESWDIAPLVAMTSASRGIADRQAAFAAKGHTGEIVPTIADGSQAAPGRRI